MKIYIAIALIVGISSSSFYVGFQVATGREAKKDVKLLSKAIEDSNEDQIEIIEHIAEVNKTTNEATREIIKIKTIVVTERCIVNDVIRLRNEAYTAYPAELFVH